MPRRSQTKAAEAKRRAKLVELAAKIPDSLASETTSDRGSRDISTSTGPPPPDIHFIEPLRKLRLADTGGSGSNFGAVSDVLNKNSQFKDMCEQPKAWRDDNLHLERKRVRREFHEYWQYRVTNGLSHPKDVSRKPLYRSEELREELQAWIKHCDETWKKIGELVLAAHSLAWIKANELKRLRELMTMQPELNCECEIECEEEPREDARRTPMSEDVIKRLGQMAKQADLDNEWYLPFGAPTPPGTFWGVRDVLNTHNAAQQWPVPWRSAPDRMRRYDLFSRHVYRLFFWRGWAAEGQPYSPFLRRWDTTGAR